MCWVVAGWCGCGLDRRSRSVARTGFGQRMANRSMGGLGGSRAGKGGGMDIGIGMDMSKG